MGKFKKGDVVKIKKDLKVGKFYGIYCFNREMNRYKGKAAIIVLYDAIDGEYLIDIDNQRYSWTDEMLEEVQENTKGKTFYKKMPNNFTGTMEIKNGLIIEIEKKRKILDKAEKEYLSAVIKPFKKRITAIYLLDDVTYNFLEIILKRTDNTNLDEILKLPCFKEGTMYKGMELNRKYTLKELELD